MFFKQKNIVPFNLTALQNMFPKLAIVPFFIILSSLYIKPIVSVNPPSPYQSGCLVGSIDVYNESAALRTFTIDLDKTDASTRWVPVAKFYKNEILDVVAAIKNLTSPLLNQTEGQLLEFLLAFLGNKIPAPFQSEIGSIAKAIGANVGDIVLYNLFHDLAGGCTSAIVVDEKGELYHTHNLDMGRLFGWNTDTHQWTMSEMLRKMVVQTVWLRGGERVFESVGIAGHVGQFALVKPNEFAVSLNGRQPFNLWGLLQWLTGQSMNAQLFPSFVMRDLMSDANNVTRYIDAWNYINHTQLLSPAYFILSGQKLYQGAVFTKSLTRTEAIQVLGNANWYLIQGTTDSGASGSWLGDRAAATTACVQQLGKNKVNASGLMNVMSSKITTTKSTIFTTIMNPMIENEMQTFIQQCPEPCWF